MDLRHEVNNTGCRRLLALIQGMPIADAATWAHDHHGWTTREELAASLIEVTDLWGRKLAVMWGAKPQQLPAPPQITHPGRVAPEKPKPTSDPAEIRRFMARHLQGR